MAEHEVTEAMVDAACEAERAYEDACPRDWKQATQRNRIRAILTALAARTTDASAASGATVLRSMPPFGPMLKSIATLGLDCTFDGKPMRDAIADAIAWCDVDLPQMDGADADALTADFHALRDRIDLRFVSGDAYTLERASITIDEWMWLRSLATRGNRSSIASSPQQRAGDGG